MLEEKGIVGPADGAKPREVYGDTGERKTVADVELVPGGGKDESETTEKVENEEEPEDLPAQAGKVEAEEEDDDPNWKKV